MAGSPVRKAKKDKAEPAKVGVGAKSDKDEAPADGEPSPEAGDASDPRSDS